MQQYNGYGAYDEPEDNEDEEHEDEEQGVEHDNEEEESEDEDDGDVEGSGEDDEEEDDEPDGDGEDDDDEHDDDDDDDEDDEMADGDEDGDDPRSSASPSKSKPLPPHLARRKFFHPPFHPFTSHPAPSTLFIEALIAIPHPCATHSLALPSCSSMLLTGSADGHIRAYDLCASANGSMPLTSAQKTAMGLGESISRGAVARGWWVNAGAEEEDEDAEGEDDIDLEGQVPLPEKKPAPTRRPEAVYSMVSQCDALWCLIGTQSGPINLTTLRHSPGTIVHTLKGHAGPVAALALSSDETALLSGGWDSTLKEWDLNTGQVVRTYPHLGTQLSSVSFQPHWPNVETAAPASDSVPVFVAPSATPVDVAMAENDDVASNASYDPLFDDAEEDAGPAAILPSNGTPGLSFPSATPGSISTPKLALPDAATVPQPSQHAPLALPNGTAPKFGATPAAPVQPVRAAPVLAPLSPTTYRSFSDDIVLTSAMDGNVVLIDRRVKSYESGGVGRLLAGDKAPPWCMSASWSADGTQVYAGRRNGTIDLWDVRKGSSSDAPNLLTSFKTPSESGVVSAVVAFPDGKHMASGSQDNIRLWNPSQIMRDEQSSMKKSSRPPFKIIAGHHGGVVSSLVVDPTNRFLISASGSRGWQGESTKVVLVHEIK